MPQNTPRGYTYPLYTDPHNFPAQMQDFATDVDTDVQAQVALAANRLDQPSARVGSPGGGLPVASNTDVTVTWALAVGIDFDPTGMFNAGTPTFFTINEAGIYLISAWATWSGNVDSTTSAVSIRITTTSAGVRGRHDVRRGVNTVPDTIETESHVTAIHRATAPGDQVSVIVRHNLPVASAVGSRSFSITKIADD